MPEYDPEAIQRAAVNVVTMPYPTLDRARLYVEDTCVLDPSAFGIIASGWVMGPYESSRATMARDLEIGLAKLEDMARGLDQTAVDVVGVDEASAEDLRKLEPDGGSSGSQASRMINTAGVAGSALALKVGVAAGAQIAQMGAALAAGSGGHVGAAVLAGALQPVHATVLGVLRASGSMAFTAAAAAGIWMLCNPNDAAVATAVGGWQEASSEIKRAKGELDSALVPLEQNWNAEDYEAFRVWVNKYNTGLDNAAAFADANGGNLQGIAGDLQQLQRTCFYVAMANLALIIALTALEMVPYIGPIITAEKYRVGISVVVQTLAGATSWLAIVNKAVDGLAGVHSSGTDGWAQLQVINEAGVDEESPGFEGLPEVDWESPVNE